MPTKIRTSYRRSRQKNIRSSTSARKEQFYCWHKHNHDNVRNYQKYIGNSMDNHNHNTGRKVID